MAERKDTTPPHHNVIGPAEAWELFDSRRFLHGHRESMKESFELIVKDLIVAPAPAELSMGWRPVSCLKLRMMAGKLRKANPADETAALLEEAAADIERLALAPAPTEHVGGTEAVIRKAGQVAIDALIDRWSGTMVMSNDDMADYMTRIVDACVRAAIRSSSEVLAGGHPDQLSPMTVGPEAFFEESDKLAEITKERDHFYNQWRACWAPLTPRSENEKQGFERVLAILKAKLSDGGGIVGPSDVQRAHNDFYRGRRVAFEECAIMLRVALASIEVEVEG